MRVLLWMPVLLAGGVALIDPPLLAAGGGEKARELFQHRCASCHTVPDPAIRTDRAWLDQVNRTA